MHLQKECRIGKAKVAVARVSCIWTGGEYAYVLFSSPAHILHGLAIKRKENAVFERPQIRPPVETLARGVKFYAIDCSTRHAGALRLPRRI